jgi:hypothetical protein
MSDRAQMGDMPRRQREAAQPARSTRSSSRAAAHSDVVILRPGRGTNPALRRGVEAAMDFLRHNVGAPDRVVRIVLGIGLLLLTVTGPQTPWGFVGVVPLLTGLVGTCPLYSLFGWTTCPARRA